ncbi:FAD-dependent oxidoreductase [Microbacterium sp. BWT-B31]|uniref:protoporphyrinogen/coproporphyrinogen oxidase n=1 Tax=Microbacterium sp. BWT-B31 TaxID=3232072 RepID=UPI0035283981
MAAEVLVAGGGVGGLVLARRLALSGRQVVVFEGSDRFGGQVSRQTVAGVDLDAAAESFAVRGGTVAALLAELGMQGDIVAPLDAPAWLHRSDGSSVALPATGVLGIPGDPGADDVVRAIGLDAARRAQRDAELPASVGADAATIGELVRLRMGDGVVDGLVAPVVRGVHSTEPDQLLIDAASPRLREELRAAGSLAAAVRRLRAAAPAGSQVAGIRGGMFRLVDALVAECERLGVRLQTGAPATDLTPHALTAGGRRVRGQVVRAAAAPGAAPGRRVTLATLVVEASAFDHAPRGTGVLVAADAPGVTARALTHLSAKWEWVADLLPGLHAVRLSYDGERADAVERAMTDAPALLGAPIERVVDTSSAVWQRRPAGAWPAMAEPAVGEGPAGTGLASVVAQAERVAAALVAEVGEDSTVDGPRGRMEG